MRKSKAVALCALAVAVVMLAAAESGRGAEKTDYRFAFAIKNLTNPFFINMAAGVERECEKYGASVNIQATESDKDIEKQNQILQTFLTQNYDAILVTPLSNVAIVPFIKECNDAKVPVIVIDTKADPGELAKLGAKMDAFVTGDNRDAGVKEAEAMVEALGGKGEIVILESTPGSSAGIAVLEGVYSVLDKSDIKVVASQSADNNRNMGYDVAQSILTANPEIQGILACNDEMALGAINALKDMDFENISVVGINNAADAQAAMKAGAMYASVDKRSDIQGATAVRRAVEILEGKEVPAEEYLECYLIKATDLK